MRFDRVAFSAGTDSPDAPDAPPQVLWIAWPFGRFPVLAPEKRATTPSRAPAFALRMSDDPHAHAAVFTNDDTRLAPGWSDEEVAAVFARTTVDLTRAPPAKDARLRLTAVFGEIDLVVPPGLALDVEGTSVFGASQAPPRTGEPTLHVTTTAVFGAIRVRESPS